MPDQRFANSSLATPLRRPQRDRDEPEFSLRDAPADTDREGQMRVASSSDWMQSRSRRTAAERPVGSLLYLVLVGFVAVATIGVFFGAGFLLLARPEMQTVADPGTRGRARLPPSGDGGQADREAPPVSRELAAADLPTVASLPDAPRAGVTEVPALEQSKAAPDSPPVSAGEEPPAWTTTEPETTSSSPVSPIPSATSASPTLSAAEDGALAGGPKHRPTHHGRRDHARSASRHSYPRSSGSAPSLTPPQSSAAQFIAPQRGKRRLSTGSSGNSRGRLSRLPGP